MSGGPDIQVELLAGHWQNAENPIGFDKVKVRLLELQNISDKIIDVNLVEWNDDHRKRAARLNRICNRDCVFIAAAFSHGVGRGIPELAKGLGVGARYLHHVHAVDGVYWNGILQWRAIWSPFVTPKIKMPDNVLLVDVYRQNCSIPKGHEIVSSRKGRVRVKHWVNPHDVTDVREFWPWVHSAMDEVPEIHDAIYESVKQFALGS